MWNWVKLIHLHFILELIALKMADVCMNMRDYTFFTIGFLAATEVVFAAIVTFFAFVLFTTAFEFVAVFGLESDFALTLIFTVLTFCFSDFYSLVTSADFLANVFSRPSFRLSSFHQARTSSSSQLSSFVYCFYLLLLDIKKFVIPLPKVYLPKSMRIL